MKLYHGTSAESAINIIKSGGFNVDKQVWHCSGDYIYFWSPDRLHELSNTVYGNAEEHVKESIMCAFDSATTAAAVQSSNSENVFVIEYTYTGSAECVEVDSSCEAMLNSGAVCLSPDDLQGRITAVYVADYSSKVSLFYLCSVLDNDFINYDFSIAERIICEQLNQLDSDSLFDVLDVQDWHALSEADILDLQNGYRTFF